MVLLRNVKSGLHKDCHNASRSLTAAVSFGQFEGGELWVADDEVAQDDPFPGRSSRSTWENGAGQKDRYAPQALPPGSQGRPWDPELARHEVVPFVFYFRAEEAMDI